MPDLDERQRLAVEAGPHDLFIAAGAGSGKTRVLTARFVAAILGEPPFTPAAPDALLTVTFTEKAAGELAERVRKGLIDAGRPDAARRISESWISTIHGMCSRIVRRHALDLGIDPHFRVLDQVESSVVLTESLDSAVGALIDEDDGVAALVDAYGFTTVVAALRSVRADLVAAGYEITKIIRIGSREIADTLHSSARESVALAGDLASLRSVKTTVANAEAARTLADVLDQAAEGGLGAQEALRALGGISFRHLRSVDGHEDLVERGKALVAAAQLCVAQRAVEDYEEAFIRALGSFAARYAEDKRVRGALDFEDLQTLTASLLSTRPDIAQRYRTAFSMIMVDEFQDTNALQMGIIELLADGDLCTVGDENQSIYSFRHADVEVFRRRGRTVATHVELDINYRIAPPLLEAINGLFSHGLLLGDSYMRLRSPETGEDRPQWPDALPRFGVTFVDAAASDSEPFEAEAAAIAARVAEYVDEGIDPGDIAVLMGALSRGRGATVERELGARGIPAVLAAGGAFFGCLEVREARALLGVLDNVHHDHALLAVLAGRISQLDADTLYKVRAAAVRLADAGVTGERRPSLWDAMRVACEGEDGPGYDRISRVTAVIEDARSRHGIRPLGETILEALTGLDYDLTLLGEGRTGMRRWANMLKLARMADEYQASEHGGLGGFLRHLELREQHGTGEQEAVLEEGDGAVRIMSIHAAKGLEFPVVVVGSLTADSCPAGIDVARARGGMLLGMTLPVPAEQSKKTIGSRTVHEARSAVRDAERRRLFYVACTRAREGLCVVGRTRSDRVADGSLTGILRTVFGMAERDALGATTARIGEGVIEVSTVSDVDAGMPTTADHGDAVVHLAPDTEEASGPTPPGDVQSPGDPVPLAQQAVAKAVPPVSYTALAAYERCAYHYYLTRIARLPAPTRRTTTEALDFGSALHLVLQRARDRNELESVVPEVMLATSVDPGREPALTAAAAAFLGSPLAGRLRGATRVDHEMPFLVPLAGTVLSGAMDVLAWEGPDALIVDYKTGVVALDEAEARERYRLQSECYALAALSAGAERAEVAFVELERGREIRFEYHTSETEQLTERIAAPVHSIGRGEFDPRDSYVRGLCDACPGFGGLCPVRRSKAGASG